MYERFTDRARKVMQLANQEAQRFNHEYIGTEHILLGLVKEGSGVAANVLKNLDIDLRKIRLEVEKIVQSGPDMVTMGTSAFSSRCRQTIAGPETPFPRAVRTKLWLLTSSTAARVVLMTAAPMPRLSTRAGKNTCWMLSHGSWKRLTQPCDEGK